MTWTTLGLRALGFEGFVPFSELPKADVPTAPGVYAVIRPSSSAPRFTETSPACWFKGRNPTASVEELERKWVDAAAVVYLGAAPEGSSGRRGLRKRLDEFRRFGAGQAVGHTGGAYLWQLADHDQLLVAWRPTPGENPDCVESRLLQCFEADHHALPFANRKRGKQPCCPVPWLPDR